MLRYQINVALLIDWSYNLGGNKKAMVNIYFDLWLTFDIIEICSLPNMEQGNQPIYTSHCPNTAKHSLWAKQYIALHAGYILQLQGKKLIQLQDDEKIDKTRRDETKQDKMVENIDKKRRDETRQDKMVYNQQMFDGS